jgi:hypothetical protein
MKLRVRFEERKCENQRVDNDKRYLKKVIRLIDCYLKPTLAIFLKLYRDMNTFYKNICSLILWANNN